jgi:hypothetical protein
MRKAGVKVRGEESGFRTWGGGLVKDRVRIRIRVRVTVRVRMRVRS